MPGDVTMLWASVSAGWSISRSMGWIWAYEGPDTGVVCVDLDDYDDKSELASCLQTRCISFAGILPI